MQNKSHLEIKLIFMCLCVPGVQEGGGGWRRCLRKDSHVAAFQQRTLGG